MRTKWIPLLLLAGKAFAQQNDLYDYPAAPYDRIGVKANYTKVWADEFNSAVPNVTPAMGVHWQSMAGFHDCPELLYYPGGSSHYGFQQLPNTLLNNNNGTDYALRIYTRKLASNQTATCNGNPTPYRYTSAFLSTNGDWQGNNKIDFHYGYFEARCRMPVGKGSWPAFWIWGNKYVGSEWRYNEIDVFENVQNMQGGPRHITHNIHIDQDYNTPNNEYHLSTGNWASQTNTVPQNTEFYYHDQTDLSADFHVYGMEWTPTSVSFYLDNKLIKTYSVSNGLLDLAAANMLNIPMWITLDGAVVESEANYSFPTENYFDIDYVRVYKKTPLISLVSGGCSVITQTISANTGSTADTYAWSVASPAIISGSSTSQTLSFTSSGPTTITLTVTDPAGQSVAHTFAYPFLNSEFVHTLNCTGSGNVLSCTANASTTGSQFALWLANASGNPVTLLETVNGTSATFTTTLTNNQPYVVRHSVWNSCNPTTYTDHLVKATFADFTYNQPVCNNNQWELTVNGLPGTTNTWKVYKINPNNTLTPVGPTINTNATSYLLNSASLGTTLLPDQRYRISHTVTSPCTGGTYSVSKVVYIPNKLYHAIFNFASYTSTAGYMNAYVSTPWTPQNSMWEVRNSDANGSIGAPIPGSTQWMTLNSGFFDDSYALSPFSYYLFTHGVWDGCANWQWEGKLVLNGQVLRTFSTADTSGSENFQAFYATVPGNTVAEHAQLEFTCSPNPAASGSLLQFSYVLTDAVVSVYNMNGAIVKSTTIGDTNQYELDLQGLPSGIYLVRVTSGTTSAVKRIVKE